jgi:arabinogalactan oligomer/maltooligosaccharide transport system permease protein
MQDKESGVILTIKRAFKDGSKATKLSFFMMGAGQCLQRRFWKGAIFILAQLAFTAFMAFGGWKALVHLFSGDLGTRVSGEVWNETLQIFEKVRGDNSFLVLLYGVAVLLLTAVYLVVWYANVKDCYIADLRVRSGEEHWTLKEEVVRFFNDKFQVPLLFFPLLGLAVFTVLPLIFMVLIAFTNYDYAHMPPGKLFDWVGFANFKALFSLSGGSSSFAAVFLRVLVWTFVWAFVATFSNYFIGILLALAINRKGIKGKALFRTLFVLSIAVPQFVSLLLMQKILDGDGILNKILGTEILWLADQRYFSLLPRAMILLVNIWVGVPYTILMATGLLISIPSDYFEAARIDGASPLKAFIHVTLPYMLQLTTPYLITQFVTNVNNFNVIWLLTGGGPVDNLYYGGGTQAQSTDLLVTWLYRLTTDKNPRYNVAAVIGIVIFVICVTASLLVYGKSSSARSEEDFQ